MVHDSETAGYTRYVWFDSVYDIHASVHDESGINRSNQRILQPCM